MEQPAQLLRLRSAVGRKDPCLRSSVQLACHKFSVGSASADRFGAPYALMPIRGQLSQSRGRTQSPARPAGPEFCEAQLLKGGLNRISTGLCLTGAISGDAEPGDGHFTVGEARVADLFSLRTLRARIDLVCAGVLAFCAAVTLIAG